VKKVIMFLDSPLQSWGGESVSYSYRTTENRPTFSAIIGILCSCIGISFRKDNEKVKELRDNIKINVISLQKGSLLKEFQSCGTNIKAKDKKDWFNKDRESGKIYTKEYLQDAKFIAILQISDCLDVDMIIKALKSPKWMPFFGRFCCMPATPILVENLDYFKKYLSDRQYFKGKMYQHVENIDAEYMVMDYPNCDGTNGFSARGIKESMVEISKYF